jgi:hypothetical protein
MHTSTNIKTDIDFEREGKQVDVLRLPDSTNVSAMRKFRSRSQSSSAAPARPCC